MRCQHLRETVDMSSVHPTLSRDKSVVLSSETSMVDRGSGYESLAVPLVLRSPICLSYGCLIGLAGAMTLCASGEAWAARSDEIDTCISSAESAQKLRNQVKLVDARSSLRLCARDACPDVVRKDCRQWLAEVNAAVPTIVVRAADSRGRDLANVRVRVDGQLVADKLDGKPIDVDPGERQFEFESRPLPSKRATVVIRTAEKNRLVSVVLGSDSESFVRTEAPEPKVDQAQPAAPALSPLVWVLYGVGASAWVGAALLWFPARAELQSLRDECAPTCASKDLDSVRRRYLLADISGAIGLVAVGAATWMVLTPRSPSRSGLAMQPIAGGAFASWSTQF